MNWECLCGTAIKASGDLTVCHWVIIPTVCVDITMAEPYAVIYTVGAHNKDGLLVRFIGCVVVVAAYLPMQWIRLSPNLT